MKNLVCVLMLFGCVDRTVVADVCDGGTDVNEVCVYVNGAPDDTFECPPGRSAQYVRDMDRWAPGTPRHADEGFICAEDGAASDDLDESWTEAGGDSAGRPPEPMPGVGGQAGQGGAPGMGGAGGVPGMGGAGGVPGMGGAGGVPGMGGAGGVPIPMGRCGHPRSECTEDADCPSGPCSRLPDVDGAPCYCIDDSIEPRHLFENCNADQEVCCAATDCEGPGAACVSDATGAKNTGRNCLPGDVFELRECVADLCDDQTPCEAGSICIPAGFREYVVNRCVPIECEIDKDCTDRPGGICVPYSECGNVRWACRYAGPCQANTDCDPEMQCWPDTGECVRREPPPG